MPSGSKFPNEVDDLCFRVGRNGEEIHPVSYYPSTNRLFATIRDVEGKIWGPYSFHLDPNDEVIEYRPEITNKGAVILGDGKFRYEPQQQ